MKLTGLGKSKDGEYSKFDLAWIRPDRELCEAICADAGFPASCAEVVGFVRLGRGIKDLEEAWALLESVITKRGGVRTEAKGNRCDGRVRMWNFLIGSRKIHAGVQLGSGQNPDSGELYAAVTGECKISCPKVPEIEYGEITTTVEIAGEGECVYDLQDGNRDAYCAFRYEVDGGPVLQLYGVKRQTWKSMPRWRRKVWHGENADRARRRLAPLPKR